MKKGRILALALLCALLAGGAASAFKPNQDGHLGITRTALESISRALEGETLRFSTRAIDQIATANKDTDCGENGACVCLSCVQDSSRHFDNEDFLSSTARLVDLKEKIILKITAESPDGASARQDLGAALHAIQDFYSHTNWVEMGFVNIDGRLEIRHLLGCLLALRLVPTIPPLLEAPV